MREARFQPVKCWRLTASLGSNSLALVKDAQFAGVQFGRGETGTLRLTGRSPILARLTYPAAEPFGHGAWVVSDEPFKAIEFISARLFAMQVEGDRVPAAMLCTDIVDSTAHLRRLGDFAWRELLLEPHLRAFFV
jgi:hypothetical protein